jgi:tRNA (guanine-N7-)-methyltransferase
MDSDNTPQENAFHRKIRSFVLRQGRSTRGQDYALENLWPIFGLVCDESQLDYSTIFKNPQAKLILEIGFGNGHSLAQMAKENPENNYIGIEVHRPGVGALLNEIERLGLTNIRCFHHDAIEVLKKNIPDNSLDAIQLFFPDPWPKTKHYKRRLVKSEFLDLLATKIKKGGVFHMATDWQDYAKDAMKILIAHQQFENTQQGMGYSPRPEGRPKTRFEQRGEDLGHGVFDLIFKKV